jgi:hypothetical protein
MRSKYQKNETGNQISETFKGLLYLISLKFMADFCGTGFA